MSSQKAVAQRLDRVLDKVTRRYRWPSETPAAWGFGMALWTTLYGIVNPLFIPRFLFSMSVVGHLVATSCTRGASSASSRATWLAIWWCSTAPNSVSCSVDSTRWSTAGTSAATSPLPPNASRRTRAVNSVTSPWCSSIPSAQPGRPLVPRRGRDTSRTRPAHPARIAGASRVAKPSPQPPPGATTVANQHR